MVLSNSVQEAQVIRMKIALIGPSFPYRGGISQYNTFLYRVLKEKHEVQFFGFSRQYPKFLYPAKSDKEYNEKMKESDIIYSLDSINPLSWFKTAKLIRNFDPDILIIPWWVVFFAPSFWTIAKRCKRGKRTKVLFICHNVIEHESDKIKERISRQVFKTGDCFLVHSNEDRKNLLDMLPDARIIKSFLPSFGELIVARDFDRNQFKSELKIKQNRILLFFGFIRPYKGLKYLLHAMKTIVERDSDVHLLIVGECMGEDKDEYVRMMAELGLDDHITFISRYVPSEELGPYFQLSNVVVLPYVSATQSAVVQLAYGFDKPVIVTNVGGLPEAVLHHKTGYVVEPCNSEQIADAVKDFFENNREEAMRREVSAFKHEFSWEKLRSQIESAVEANGGNQNPEQMA